MRLLLLIVSILCFEKVYNFSFNHPKYALLGDDSVHAQWIVQYLDHFNTNDARTWNQRYFVNSHYFKRSKNVVFLFIGGESKLNNIMIQSSTWIDYAKYCGAICFNLEHRYYGESHPTRDLSVANLRYLTSRQALADAQYFIQHINSEYNFSRNVKWIVFGASYAGSLAAWMKLLYPNLVHGVVSLSAPLKAVLNFKEFYKNVYDVIHGINPRCPTAIQRGFQKIEQLLYNRYGRLMLDLLFRLGMPLEQHFNNPDDISLLFATLAENFVNLVTKFGSCDENSMNINNICNIMTDRSVGPELERLSIANALYLNFKRKRNLNYSFNGFIQNFRNIEWGQPASEGYRQWLYQQCTEFGLFHTSDHTPQIFGRRFPLPLFIKMCQLVFGQQYDYTFINNGVDRTNRLYHGLDIDISNVIYIHGEYDPWKTLGITRSTRNGVKVVIMEGCSHCAGTYHCVSESRKLKAAKSTILKYIRDLLTN